MFNLEEKISNWRKQMLAAGIKTPVPLEELENHLREEIERQMESGLSEQKAFEIAVAQIGQAHILETEFKKSDTKERRPLKFLATVCGLLIIALGCVALVQALLAFSDIKGWLINGGSEIIGDTHTVEISARLWAMFMCLFPLFLIFMGLVLFRLGFRKKRRIN